MLTLRVLGSAAGGGYPQWNCNCPRCDGLRRGRIRAQARTQSSVAVGDGRSDWLLFNASPDILAQIRAFDALQPARALRDTGIAAVALLDAQIDHSTGLLMLREHRERLRVWCTSAVRDDLSSGNPLFAVLEHYCGIDWQEWRPGASDSGSRPATGARPRFGDIELTPIALTSNAPPFSPHRDKPRPGDTVGVLMHDTLTDRKLFYAPGLGMMEDAVWAAMQAADVVLVDGTVWRDDEMIALGASAKTGRAMGHLPQSGPGGMIEWLDRLPDATRKVLIHINNTNPILDEDSEERATLTRHGIEVAYDGMEIRL